MNTNSHHDRSPRAAIAEMAPDRWAAWRSRGTMPAITQADRARLQSYLTRRKPTQ